MTDEQQILKLVQEHFEVGGIRDDGSCSEYYGNFDAFLKFARAIREDGYNEGWESGNVSTKMNSLGD